WQGHVDDLDRRAGAGRRDGAPDVAGLRVLPHGLLVGPLHRARHGCLAREERGEADTEPGAEPAEQHGSGVRLAALDARNHGAADACLLRERIERQPGLLAQRLEPAPERPRHVFVRWCIIQHKRIIVSYVGMGKPEESAGSPAYRAATFHAAAAPPRRAAVNASLGLTIYQRRRAHDAQSVSGAIMAAQSCRPFARRGASMVF